jgi:hypothetical protein
VKDNTGAITTALIAAPSSVALSCSAHSGGLGLLLLIVLVMVASGRI